MLLMLQKRNLLGYVGSDSRDLKRVERDITDSVLSKEQAYLEISKLNNEQKSLNEKISRMWVFFIELHIRLIYASIECFLSIICCLRSTNQGESSFQIRA